MKKKLVILTGAGIDSESGIPTFRTGTNSLWENHKIEDVASPAGWQRNKELVQEFYNQRRKDVLAAKPNAAHEAIVALEEKYDVYIVTTNVSDLHERAGSKKVLHIHGEITKSQSSLDPKLVYPIEGDILKMGDKCEKGSQLRPNVVWFGEEVPLLHTAMGICYDADIFILCGSSLSVYPAAGIIQYLQPGIPKYVVDIDIPEVPKDFIKVPKSATIGLPLVVEELLK